MTDSPVESTVESHIEPPPEDAPPQETNEETNDDEPLAAELADTEATSNLQQQQEPLLSPAERDSLRLEGALELGRLSLDVATLRGIAVGTRFVVRGEAGVLALRVHGVVVGRLRVVSQSEGDTVVEVIELGDGSDGR